MYKPTRDMRDVRFFIKKKDGWFLVAGWVAKKGNELHWDYVFVKNREEWEKIIKDLEPHCHSK